ncbi:hypothetical protein D3C80_2205590 [compost metagenome]
MAPGSSFGGRLEITTVGRSSSYRPLMIANRVASSNSVGLVAPTSSRISRCGVIRLLNASPSV